MKEMSDKADKADELTAEKKAAIWKGMYFRAQAGMERYLVSNHGYGAINEWIEHTAGMTAKQSQAWKTEGALPFVRNLKMIMDCWDSKAVEARDVSTEGAEIEISGCGILEYRKQARELGIELTFDDPCREYCTRLLGEIARKQGLEPRFVLKAGGCRWNVERKKPAGEAKE
jgi:hypothetical protein